MEARQERGCAARLGGEAAQETILHADAAAVAALLSQRRPALTMYTYGLQILENTGWDDVLCVVQGQQHSTTRRH